MFGIDLFEILFLFILFIIFVDSKQLPKILYFLARIIFRVRGIFFILSSRLEENLNFTEPMSSKNKKQKKDLSDFNDDK